PTTALLLGVRHGLDWDHLAAIMDIAGAAPATASTKRGVSAPVEASAMFWEWSGFRSSSLRLASYYAVGHAAVVAILGLVAIAFSVVLPAWIEPVMQRVVGATLLLFGLYILYSLRQFSLGKQEFRMRSRSMLIIDAVKMGKFRSKLQDCEHERPQPGCCGPRSAFVMGMIHGIGAETGTQVLLLSALAGSGSGASVAGLSLLCCFVAGMFLSNTILALVVSAGAETSRISAPLKVVAGLLTAGFSLWLGIVLVLGSTTSYCTLSPCR
ncbi:MAG: hypothetical protein ACRD3W_08315, partial [Terriglobales bacterium]